MIKEKDVAYVRTTGEPVMVLEILKDGTVEVKRPVETRDEGVIHREELFYTFELESKDERLDREYQERKAMEERVFGKSKAGSLVEVHDFTGGGLN
jgi:hypothetical protein